VSAIDRSGLHAGLTLFAEGHWFEAHEVLEAAWRPLPHGPERHFLQGLIQLAVALEHWRRGNPRGARGQWEKAQRHLEGLPDVYAGVALAALLADFRAYWTCVGLQDAPASIGAGGADVGGPDATRCPPPVPEWQP
jgi:predicted metal-dependent hydrolase